MVIMSLDYGDRYVGVAMSDREGKTALRYSMIDKKKKQLLEELKRIIEVEEVEKIIVGVPLGLMGNVTAQTEVSRDFIEILRERLGEQAEIEEADETFTSKEARRRLLAEGGRVEDEHTEAARLILEQYIKKHSKSP